MTDEESRSPCSGCIRLFESKVRLGLSLSLVLVLEATEPVSKAVTQMAVELINNHLIELLNKQDSDI